MGILDEMSGIAAGINSGGVEQINVDLIDADPTQPRTKSFDELDPMVVSIKTVGVFTPVLVRKVENGRYMLITGERRWRASQMAGVLTIPAIVRDDCDDLDARYELQMFENTMRRDFLPIEVQEAVVWMHSRGVSQTKIAERIGKHNSDVSGILLMADPANAKAVALLGGESHLLLQKFLSKKFPAYVRELMLARGERVNFTQVEAARALADEGGVFTAENLPGVMDAISAGGYRQSDLLRMLEPAVVEVVQTDIPHDLIDHATSTDDASEDLEELEDFESAEEVVVGRIAVIATPPADTNARVAAVAAMGDDDEGADAWTAQLSGNAEPDCATANVVIRDNDGDIISSDYKNEPEAPESTFTVPAMTISNRAARKLIRLLGGDGHINEHDVLITLADLINKL